MSVLTLSSRVQVTEWWAKRAADYYTIGRALSMPVAITEFGGPLCYCASAAGIQSARVGWILWELISEHPEIYQFGAWGLVDASGRLTVPASVMACILKLTSAPIHGNPIRHQIESDERKKRMATQFAIRYNLTNAN